MSWLITRLSRQGSRRYLFGGLLRMFIMGGGVAASSDTFVIAQPDIDGVIAQPDIDIVKTP